MNTEHEPPVIIHISRYRRRRKKKKSSLGTLIQIFLGGITGVIVGHLILVHVFDRNLIDEMKGKVPHGINWRGSNQTNQNR